MILAAVSGGLDSVAMLYKLLREGERVHVHHISLRTRFGRWRAEDRAMQAIVPWLRAWRPFDYTESVVEKPGTYDIVAVSKECARLVIAGTIPRPSALARGANFHDMGPAAMRQRLAVNAWQRLLGASAPPIILPIKDMRRAELWAMLPPELRNLTASCRRPREENGRWVYCGGCKTCNELTREGVTLERSLAA